MKTYINPMLHIVSIKNNDILTVSGYIDATGYVEEQGAAGRRFEDWDAGY